MDTTDALAALRSLSVDAIRARLAELDAEAQSLRTLLRAALARERVKERAQGSPTAPAGHRPHPAGGRHGE